MDVDIDANDNEADKGNSDMGDNIANNQEMAGVSDDSDDYYNAMMAGNSAEREDDDMEDEVNMTGVTDNKN